MEDKVVKILCVEDDELDRMIIKRAVKSSGMQIDLSFAEDIDEGKEQTTNIEYDCIFLDYNLPGGTGLELLKDIRNSGNDSPREPSPSRQTRASPELYPPEAFLRTGCDKSLCRGIPR